MKEKLLNLRNQGLTFDNIAKEMDMSKPTVFFRIRKFNFSSKLIKCANFPIKCAILISCAKPKKTKSINTYSVM